MAIENSLQITSVFLTEEVRKKIFTLAHGWAATIAGLNDGKTYYAVGEHVVTEFSPFSPAIKLTVENRYTNKYTDLYAAKLKNPTLELPPSTPKFVPVEKSVLDITINGLSCGLITARFECNFKTGKIIPIAKQNISIGGAIGSLHLKDVLTYLDSLTGVDPLAAPFYSTSEPAPLP